MKLNINEKINLHELLFDIALMVSQYIYSLLSKDKMAIAKNNEGRFKMILKKLSLNLLIYQKA